MRYLSTTLIALLALFVTTGNENAPLRTGDAPQELPAVAEAPPTSPSQVSQEPAAPPSRPQVQIRELTEQEKQDLERKIEEAKRNDPEFRRLMEQFPNLGGIQVGSSDSPLNFGNFFNSEESDDAEAGPAGDGATQMPAKGNVVENLVAEPVEGKAADDAVQATHFESFLRRELGRIDRRLWNAFHNISHRRTYAYKSFRFEFPEALPRFDGDSERITIPKMNGPVPIDVDMSQGAIVETGRPLDIAIEGDGFLAVRNSRTVGIMYTRAGRLTIDRNGALAVSVSYRSEDSGLASEVLDPQIDVPEGSLGIKITGRGNVWIKDAQGNDVHAGTLHIVSFPKPERLRPLDERFFEETPDSGDPVVLDNNAKGFPVLRQGCLECSNVDVETVLDEIDRLREQRHGLQQLLR